MRHFRTLLAHELRSAALSWNTWAAAGLFLVLMGGIHFFALLEGSRAPSDRTPVESTLWFFWLPLLCVLPLLTMRTFAEERRAGTLAALIRRIGDGTLSHNAARQVLDALWTAADPQADPQADASRIDGLIDSMGLRQISDTGALAAIVDEVVAANPKSVEEFRAGKDKAFNALVGQVMKASRGKANPAQVNDLLRQRLG